MLKEKRIPQNFSSNVFGNSNDGTNFSHKLLLTNTEVLVFLGRFLRPLLKTGSLLMKNVLRALAKSALIPLGLTAAAAPTDTAI